MNSAGTSTSAGGLLPVPYSFNATGGLGGGFVGAQKQWQSIVVGIEADLQGASLTGHSGPIPDVSSPAFPYLFSTKVTFYDSVRGRLGFAADRWLLFATAGLAFGRFSTSYGFTLIPTPFFTNTATMGGWTAGAGINYAVLNNVFLTLEYRYTALIAAPYTDAASNSGDTGNTVKISDIRAGIGFKF